MSNADFRELLNRYLNDTLTPAELHELLQYLQKHENTEALKQAVQQALNERSFNHLSDKSRTDSIFRKIMQQAENGPPASKEPVIVPRITRWRWIAAASILLAVVTGAYFFLQKDNTAKSVATIPQQKAPVNDVAPGGNKAILQLADGSLITLDDSATGLLAQQGNTKIIKLNNGRLSYNCSASPNAPVLYNTITTPRGGQYHIILPDGSHVWLNAASSLRFPTVFAGEERNVLLKGEAYFEVASLPLRSGQKMPFRVNVNDKAEVEVLGTHFNVNAYENEAVVNTTLLEGKVKVSTTANRHPDGYREATLRPGQQAMLTHDARFTIDDDVDTEPVIAWKNGLFQFSSSDIQTIMRQLERWYDVEVQYKGPIPDGHYSGIVPRANNLLKVLRILEESDLRFKLEGKTLTVL